MLTPAQAFAALRAELRHDTETPEPGYLTTVQWAAAGNRSLSQTRLMLSDGIKTGSVKVKMFRTFAGARTMPVRHYKIEAKSKP